MDQAIAATDLGAGRGSWWHPVLDVLQWLALLTAVVGAGWLGVLALAGYLQFPLPPAPTVEGFPLPTLLLVGGLALGVLLALLAIPLTRWTAAARTPRAPPPRGGDHRRRPAARRRPGARRGGPLPRLPRRPRPGLRRPGPAGPPMTMRDPAAAAGRPSATSRRPSCSRSS